MTVVLDPTSGKVGASIETVPRPASIQGLIIGLLDISKPRGSLFLDRLEARLTEAGASVIPFTKPAPVDLRHEIATNCDAVIEALAD